MPKQPLMALAGGALSAVAVSALLQGTLAALLVAYLAALPLFLVGFSMGPRMAAVAVAAGFVVSGLLGGTALAGIFGLAFALPAWMVVRQALLSQQGAWYPAGAILAWLSVLAAGMFLLAAGMLWGAEGGIRSVLSGVVDQLFLHIAPNLQEVDRTELVAATVSFLPAAAGASLVVTIVINALVAQGILARGGWNIRPVPSLDTVSLPEWSSWVLVVSAALTLLGTGGLEYIGRNLTVILAVPFFFMGLVVAHTWARRAPYGAMALGGMYLTLLMTGWLSGFLVTGLGVIEQWAGIRRRFGLSIAGRKIDDGEETN